MLAFVALVVRFCIMTMGICGMFWLLISLLGDEQSQSNADRKRRPAAQRNYFTQMIAAGNDWLLSLGTRDIENNGIPMVSTDS
jgi:hypothetical protein